MFQWLNEILSSILRFIPRVRIVPSTHGGVAFVRGRARLVPSGRLYPWWPLWTELLIVPVVRQTLNLPNQVLVPRGGSRAVILSAVVVYDIPDPVRALSMVHDLDDAVRDMALVAVRQVAARHRAERLWWDPEKVNRALLKAVRARVRGWGVHIQQVFLSDAAPCTVIRTVGETDVTVLPEEAADD